MRHTPGPWERDGKFIYALNEDGCNRFDASINGGFVRSRRGGYDEITPAEEIEATARLIAAAPELLEALKLARTYVQKWADVVEDIETHEVIEHLREVDAAIAKADGDGAAR